MKFSVKLIKYRFVYVISFVNVYICSVGWYKKYIINYTQFLNNTK